MNITVVGAGPGGIAAAVTAAENGATVRLLDENPRVGGQIWRHGPGSSIPKAAARWLQRMRKLDIEIQFGVTAVGRDGRHLLVARDAGGLGRVPFDKLILATGARELFLPFPGWTLPNVMGCGGAQALLKAGMPVKGKRVVVAGSGPLLLAVAAAYAEKGARVIGVLEQANVGGLTKFIPELLRHPSKLLQGIGYVSRFLPALLKPGHWVLRAHGQNSLEGVTVTDGSREWRWDCDILACGFGLVPNIELAVSMGCRAAGDRIAVDEWQRTSQGDIYCVGESTGVGGEDIALLEGEIAALSASEGPALEAKIRARRGWNSFQANLESAFRLRPELTRLAEDNTVVCRCEDVTYGSLKGLKDQRTAKLYTRCGMGPCQGRVCGAACRALFGWELNRPRWPLVPLKMDALETL